MKMTQRDGESNEDSRRRHVKYDSCLIICSLKYIMVNGHKWILYHLHQHPLQVQPWAVIVQKSLMTSAFIVHDLWLVWQWLVTDLNLNLSFKWLSFLILDTWHLTLIEEPPMSASSMASQEEKLGVDDDVLIGWSIFYIYIIHQRCHHSCQLWLCIVIVNCLFL